jgi:hypothetical protein
VPMAALIGAINTSYWMIHYDTVKYDNFVYDLSAYLHALDSKQQKMRDRPIDYLQSG